ncbi:DinB family protein [Nocardioides massiliensis]|uniref:DinB-like domain-containing protein n=1 Tax=Nocardioides massiliensis TaxID=1325935 RepID=A0ABT9NSI6_9ACTN|nr:DinB family protein [Nocardioides massiliensis]MDP9823363.1 hypothetical protein [Nocardioides massiliensis]
MNWNALLLDQLSWHWDHHLRPRLAGLSDDEYRREPVAGCWNARPEGDPAAAPIAGGTGPFRIDFAMPEPEPAPVTTIAWRIGHLVVAVLGERNHSHFGGPPISYPDHAYAGTADEALAQLDEHYGRWVEGVRGLGEDGLARPCGPAEGPWADAPMGALVLHIHREMIHHGSELCLLRDLYRAGAGAQVLGGGASAS